MRPGAADTMLERVLDNARRYGQPPYALAASVADGRVRLKVSSEGAELKPDEVHLAFELFYRGEGAVTSAPGSAWASPWRGPWPASTTATSTSSPGRGAGST